MNDTKCTDECECCCNRASITNAVHGDNNNEIIWNDPDPHKKVNIDFPTDPVKLSKVLDILFNGDIMSFNLNKTNIDRLREITLVRVVED